MTDPNTIASYDEHVERYLKDIGAGSAHRFLEKPAMYAKLPDFTGKKVLCIGCGGGDECTYLKSLGATVIGIDISAGLVEHAKKKYPDIEFHVMDMEKLAFNDAEFDYAYSSLVMHYVESWTAVLGEVKRVLKPNSIFLFSTHHPVRWGAVEIEKEGKTHTLLGYAKSETELEIFGDYLTTRKIHDVWGGGMEVDYYSRPLSSLFADIRASGFEMLDFLEPKAIDAAKEPKRKFWEIHQKLPLFMIFELKVP